MLLVTAATIIAYSLPLARDTLPDCDAALAGRKTSLEIGDTTVYHSSRSHDALRVLLAGEYRLIVIGSQGFGAGRWVQEWDIVLSPDSVARSARRVGGPPTSLILTGNGSLVWDGPLQKPKRAAKRTFSAFRVLASTEDVIELQQEPFDVMDGNGTTYSADHIDGQGTWVGTWMSGGFEVVAVTTPSATVHESWAGYFCLLPARLLRK